MGTEALTWHWSLGSKPTRMSRRDLRRAIRIIGGSCLTPLEKFLWVELAERPTNDDAVLARRMGGSSTVQEVRARLGCHGLLDRGVGATIPHGCRPPPELARLDSAKAARLSEALDALIYANEAVWKANDVRPGWLSQGPVPIPCLVPIGRRGLYYLATRGGWHHFDQWTDEELQRVEDGEPLERVFTDVVKRLSAPNAVPGEQCRQ